MKRTSAHVKADLAKAREKYEQIIQKNDPSDDEALRAEDEHIAALVAEYSERAQDEQRANDNREAMLQIFRSDEPQAVDDGDRTPKAPEIKTFAESVLNNPEMKAYLASLTGGGTRPISPGVPIKSPTVELQGPQYGATLMTGLSSTAAGAFVVNERTNIVVPAVRAAMRAVDLLTRIPVSSDNVEYVRIGTETNAAAPVLEATTVGDGAKAESSSAMAIVNVLIESIAHWIPVTRRALADAGQLRAYLDDFLRWGLLDTLNDQVVNGTGSTPELMGIDDLSGKQTQAWSNDILETTRKARTLVSIGTGGASPSAYLMNPAEWESIDLLQDNEARYFFGGPSRVGTPILWGLPVVEDEAVTAGLGWVGDWRMGIIFDREGVSVLISDSHSDYFNGNILVLLAEMRCGIGWLRPAAFVEIDLSA